MVVKIFFTVILGAGLQSCGSDDSVDSHEEQSKVITSEGKGSQYAPTASDLVAISKSQEAEVDSAMASLQEENDRVLKEFEENSAERSLNIEALTERLLSPVESVPTSVLDKSDSEEDTLAVIRAGLRTRRELDDLREELELDLRQGSAAVLAKRISALQGVSSSALSQQYQSVLASIVDSDGLVTSWRSKAGTGAPDTLATDLKATTGRVVRRDINEALGHLATSVDRSVLVKSTVALVDSVRADRLYADGKVIAAYHFQTRSRKQLEFLADADRARAMFSVALAADAERYGISSDYDVYVDYETIRAANILAEIDSQLQTLPGEYLRAIVSLFTLEELRYQIKAGVEDLEAYEIFSHALDLFHSSTAFTRGFPVAVGEALASEAPDRIAGVENSEADEDKVVGDLVNALVNNHEDYEGLAEHILRRVNEFLVK